MILYKQERIYAAIREGVGLEKEKQKYDKKVHLLGFPDVVSSFIQDWLYSQLKFLGGMSMFKPNTKILLWLMLVSSAFKQNALMKHDGVMRIKRTLDIPLKRQGQDTLK